MNGCRPVPGFGPAACALPVNRWIAGKVAETAAAVTAALEAYKFNEAAGALYQFAWGTFCDWYLEFTKPILAGGDAAAADETRAASAWALDRLLRLLHPFVPFVTEELHAQTGGEGLLITAPWPDGDAALVDRHAAAEMDWVVRLVSEVRSIRAQYRVEPAKPIAIGFRRPGTQVAARIAAHRGVIERLARLSAIEPDLADDSPEGAIQVALDQVMVYVFIADAVDLGAERARLEKEIASLDGEIARFDAKLANEAFLKNAPETVIEEHRDRRQRAARDHAVQAQALQRLAAL